jgi:hypothetical protein
MALRRRAPLLVALGAVISLAGYWLAKRGPTVADLRASIAPEQRSAFDLLVALGGLEAGGDGDWTRAEQLCRGLGWPRCDRPALEEMKVIGRLDAGQKPPSSVAARAVADLTWAFGSAESVKAMAGAELARLAESDGPARARVLLRFGIVDANPDGQAALFNQACVADPSICSDPAAAKGAAERETRARRVPPGNALPLYFLGGHPRAP